MLVVFIVSIDGRVCHHCLVVTTSYFQYQVFLGKALCDDPYTQQAPCVRHHASRIRHSPTRQPAGMSKSCHKAVWLRAMIWSKSVNPANRPLFYYNLLIFANAPTGYAPPRRQGGHVSFALSVLQNSRQFATDSSRLANTLPLKHTTRTQPLDSPGPSIASTAQIC